MNYSDDKRIPKIADYVLGKYHYHLTKRLGESNITPEEFTEEFKQIQEMTNIVFGKDVLLRVVHEDAD